jgi:hypothetical protein
MPYDKSTSAALVAAALADEERMTPGPWSDANGKGSAVVRSNHPDYDCAIYINVRNGEVDECVECVERWQGDAFAIASMRNRNLAMATQLKAAIGEVESAHRELERWRHGVTIEGDYVCPAELELTNRAPTTADIQRLADVVLDYMERNGAPPMWATETLCRLIKGGK